MKQSGNVNSELNQMSLSESIVKYGGITVSTSVQTCNDSLTTLFFILSRRKLECVALGKKAKWTHRPVHHLQVWRQREMQKYLTVTAL